MYKGRTMKFESYNKDLDDLIRQFKKQAEAELSKPIKETMHDKDEEEFLDSPGSKYCKNRIKNEIKEEVGL